MDTIRSVFMKSTPAEGREGSRTPQRETLCWDTVATADLADPWAVLKVG